MPINSNAIIRLVAGLAGTVASVAISSLIENRLTSAIEPPMTDEDVDAILAEDTDDESEEEDQN